MGDAAGAPPRDQRAAKAFSFRQAWRTEHPGWRSASRRSTDPIANPELAAKVDAIARMLDIWKYLGRAEPPAESRLPPRQFFPVRRPRSPAARQWLGRRFARPRHGKELDDLGIERQREALDEGDRRVLEAPFQSADMVRWTRRQLVFGGAPGLPLDRIPISASYLPSRRREELCNDGSSAGYRDPYSQ